MNGHETKTHNNSYTKFIMRGAAQNTNVPSGKMTHSTKI